MLKALVFDFDGVIVDTETQWYYIYRDWLKKVYHYDLSIQDYLVCVGSSSERLFAFLKQELGTDEDIRKFEKQAMAEFIERTRTLPAMEGVTELVTAAKKKGLRLAMRPLRPEKNRRCIWSGCSCWNILMHFPQRN